MEIKVIASSSSGNAYLVKEGNTEILIECGIQFKKLQQALDFRVSSLAGCLVSHSHKDHSRSVKDLLKVGCPVYMMAETGNELGIPVSQHYLVIPGLWLKVGDFLVMPLEMNHDVPCVGFYVAAPSGESLLFATDTAEIIHRPERVDYLMLECNYDTALLSADEDFAAKHRVLATHMSLDGLIRYLHKADYQNVKGIIIMHLSSAHSDEAMFKRRIEEAIGRPVTVAQK